jgi:hypothetical protein
MIDQVDSFIQISKEKEVLPVDSELSSASSSQKSNSSKRQRRI